MKKLLPVGIVGMSMLILSGCSSSPTANTAAPGEASPTSSPITELATPNLSATASPMSSPLAIPNSKTIVLTAQNNSGQNGTAVITPTQDGKINVMITLQGGKFTQPQPAHIHVGSCPNPGAVKYPLSNVVNGKSSTNLPITWDQLTQLLAAGPLAINVHKSAAASNVYTACGNIQ